MRKSNQAERRACATALHDYDMNATAAHVMRDGVEPALAFIDILREQSKKPAAKKALEAVIALKAIEDSKPNFIGATCWHCEGKHLGIHCPDKF